MGKEYKKVQKYFNRNGLTRIPHGAASESGSITPCNCCHLCSYGRGKAFCFPCYQKLVAVRVGTSTLKSSR